MGLPVQIGIAVASIGYSLYAAKRARDNEDGGPETLAGNEITGTSEGDPINVLYGRRARVPGSLIWTSPKSIEEGTGDGGKGGPSGAGRASMDNVFQSFSVKFAKGTKIDEMLRIWANNLLLFDADPTFSITDDRYEIDQLSIGPSATWMDLWRLSPFAPQLHPSSVDPFLNPGFPPGSEITVSGATASGNNGGPFVVYYNTLRHVNQKSFLGTDITSISGDASSDLVTVTLSAAHEFPIGTTTLGTVFQATGSPSIIGQHYVTFDSSTAVTFPFVDPAASYSSPFAFSAWSTQQQGLRIANPDVVDGTLGDTLTLTRTAEKIRSGILDTMLWDDGDETIDETIDDVDEKRSPQTANPTIALAEGPLAYPMLGHAKVTFGEMLLNDFGNSTPNIAIECVADSDETTVTAIQKIATRGGLTGAQVDTAKATTRPLYHHVWRGVQRAAEVMAPLMDFGDYLSQEDGGVLRVFDRDPVFRAESRLYDRESPSTAVSYTSTTLTDTEALWEEDEWVGANVTADGQEITVASNTGTVITATGSWGTTPTAQSEYAINSVDSTSTTLTDSEQDWSTNRWAGATVTCNGKTMTVTTNTSTALTGASWSGGGDPGVGNSYEIDPGTDVPIDSDDLAARESGAESVERVTIKQRSDIDNVPTEVHLSYVDIDRDHDRGTADERDETEGADNVLKLNSPIGMTRAQANAMATRMLWTTIAQRDEVTFSLSPKHMFLLPGDRVVITEAGEPRTVLITKMDSGANGVIQCEGIVEQVVDLRPSGEVNVRATI